MSNINTGIKTMKKYFGLMALTAFCGSVSANEVIDLLVVVEPDVYISTPKETLQKNLVEQLDYANKEYASLGVELNIVAVLEWENNAVSGRLSQGESFWNSLAGIMYSVRFEEAEFIKEFPHDLYGIEYNQNAYDVLREYHADKLVFITKERDLHSGDTGYAFENMGFGLQAEGMTGRVSLLAHELGHNFGLIHPSNETCSTQDFLMCPSTSLGTQFSEQEVTRVKGVLAKDSTYFDPMFDEQFYSGWFSEKMPYFANVKLSVTDNPIAKDVTQTEVVVELVNQAGNPVTFDDTVSVEVFTEAVTATLGKNYDDDFYQRISFMPGESTKRLDLNVTHSSTEKTFNVGARYGLNVSDSDVVSVAIKPNGNESSEGNGDSGGSMGLISLLLLAGFRFLRK